MRITLLFLTVFITSITFGQQTSSFNLDFEKVSNKTPSQWNNFGNGDYKISLDSTVTQQDNYSVSIESSKDDKEFWA